MEIIIKNIKGIVGVLIAVVLFGIGQEVNAATLTDNFVYTSSIQSNGKIVIGGDFTTYNGTSINRIARLNADGSLDSAFNPGAGANNTVRAIAIQSDGKIIIGGYFTAYNGTTINRIARLNADGSLDSAFNPGTGANTTIHTITIQSDGKIVIGGNFTLYNGISRNRVARINADGSLDSSFSPGTGTTSWIYASAIQSDGKILIGGMFTTYNGVTKNRIARLNANGTLDATFIPGTGVNNSVQSIAIQSDGKIIIGGYFTAYNGTPRNYIARINADGSLDSSFSPSAGANGGVFSTTIQSDGKIVIGGDFTTYNGTSINRIARLNTDSSIDMSFDIGNGLNNYPWTINILSDGKIVIGGNFTVYDGVTMNYIALINTDGSLESTFGNLIQMPIATTQTVSSVTATSTIGNGTIANMGTDNPERFIQYGKVSGTYTNECIAGTGATGQYSCQITNLTPNTTYYYRAKATNSAGTSYGEEMSFTTLPLQDTTITDPDPTDITNATTEGYFTLNSGSIDNTSSVTTTVNITIQDGIFNAVFPQNTTITETTSQPFNFQNLTAQNVTSAVQSDQPTSRAAVRIGIPGEKLSFSQDITLTVNIEQAFNNQTLDILYQQEGESDWHTHGTCTVSNGQCVFTTNHATIYTINGTHQTTGDTPLNLNVQVQETLSMDCFDPSDSNTTVSLGTTANPGMITAGTPAVGQSRCTVTTNADQGYYLTVENSNPSNATLTHTDPHTGTLYEITDTTAWNETTKTTSNWTAPTTKGLGFSVITFPETDTTHNEFDGVWNDTSTCPEGLTADTNDYAGIPTTSQAIAAVTSYQSDATTTDICYKVDVPASQPSGQYSGQITFTATSDASGYWE